MTLIEALLRDGQGADTILRNGRVVNVITGEIYPADVALKGEAILRAGNCADLEADETQIVDLAGAYVIPGLIDAHMHFESAMLTATEFSRLSIPTGTTTIVADPHEIGNVLGPSGMREMAVECAALPNRIHLRVPCRTPDVPGVETAGYDITSQDVPEMLEFPTVDGIGEIQGVAAPDLVFRHTPEVFEDVALSTAFAQARGKVVDGNAAAIFGNELAAHIIAGGTEISCHETTTKKEAVEKLRYGVYVLMREGSTQRNMAECIRAYTEEGMDPRRLCLCTDDMLPDDLQERGHMNDVVRRTIAAGIQPVVALQMATINPATWMGLRDVGVIAPGKLADLAIIGDLEQMDVRAVYLGGRRVAEDGELLIDLPKYRYPQSVKESVRRGPVSAEELMIPSDHLPKEGSAVRVRAVGLIPDQNLSHAVEASLPVRHGRIEASPTDNVVYVAVVERHSRTGEVGKAFIHGFGMQTGAIAETVSHDTHNIIVMGTNQDDMAVAVNEVIAMQGGIALADSGEVIGTLRLPVAGLLTDELTAPEMSSAVAELTSLAQERLGVQVHGPFMHLAFLSLATSPVWKITDRGLLDVERYSVLPAVVEATTDRDAERVVVKA
jgi:adenine deaminase